ncbi:MAG TPA: PEPxxWA-CTERM sorting domain-containing protein [Novosphingobium sp.]
MKKTYLLAAALVAGMVPAASQAATVIGGSVSGVSAYTGNNGLIINYSLGSAFSGLVDLDPNTAIGSSFVVNNLFTIGTPEGSVELGEDTISRAINVTFNFTDPNGASGSAITGTTSGFYRLFSSCGAIAGGCGQVDFSSTPTIFSFGKNGSGKFSVQLFDTEFATPGSASVKGKFTLLANAVPEPSTWAMMIMGIGFAGAAMRSRRRQQVSLTYA